MFANHLWSLRELDLVTLRLFVAVVEEGTMAQAAEREKLALSAVSRRISDLELRCGVTLLDRHDRGVTPTAAGVMLLRQVREVLHLLERIIVDMEAVRGGARGLVRVQTHMSAIASGQLPQRLTAFLQKHPGIDIELEEFTSLEVIHAVRGGVADVGLISGNVDGEDLVLLPWLEDELVVLLPQGHPLAEHARLQLSQLLGEPFIGMQRDSALLSLYRKQAAAQGRPLRERAHATSFESVRNMVAAGLGVAILPAVAAYPFAEERRIIIRPLAEIWARRPLMLCMRDPEKLSAAAKLLVQHLRESPQG